MCSVGRRDYGSYFRLLSHCCKPWAELHILRTSGKYGIVVLAWKDIRDGEEMSRKVRRNWLLDDPSAAKARRLQKVESSRHVLVPIYAKLRPSSLYIGALEMMSDNAIAGEPASPVYHKAEYSVLQRKLQFREKCPAESGGPGAAAFGGLLSTQTSPTWRQKTPTLLTVRWRRRFRRR